MRRAQSLGQGTWQGEALALLWSKMGKKTFTSTKIPLAVVLRRLWERKGKIGQLELKNNHSGQRRVVAVGWREVVGFWMHFRVRADMIC